MVFWLATLAQAGMVDRIAAVVNDEVIALSEVYDLGRGYILERCPGLADECVKQAEIEILDVQIRRSLIEQELRRLDLAVTAADIDDAINRTVAQYPSLQGVDDLRAEVERSGKPWSAYRDEMQDYLRTERFQLRVLAPQVSINDDEVLDKYQREKRKMKRKTASVKGFGMALPDGTTGLTLEDEMMKALDLVAKLNTGEADFATVQTEQDSANMASTFTREVAEGELVEALDRTIFTTPEGQVAAPVRIGNILFVLKVDSFGERSEVLSFEEVKDQLKNAIFQQRLQEAEEQWYQRARREAAVDVKIK
ncbi:MAG: peptidyl-prolyl cis-trans isomerase [Myxococcota bacterium]